MLCMLKCQIAATVQACVVIKTEFVLIWTRQGACPDSHLGTTGGCQAGTWNHSVPIPYHHTEGASSLSGDSNSMHHSPACVKCMVD